MHSTGAVSFSITSLHDERVVTLGVFVLGLACVVLRLDRSAYRFAGTTLTIVVLASHEKAAWVAALHRFVEVSIGIGVGLLIIVAWPEREATPTAKST